MNLIESGVTEARASAVSGDARATVFVDCVEGSRQDVLALWLAQSGFRVREGPVPPPAASATARSVPAVLLTDRFGPEHGNHVTISEMKDRWRDLRVVVIGRGDGSETAELSLARAAGADATLPAPLARERVLEILDRWS